MKDFSRRGFLAGGVAAGSAVALAGPGTGVAAADTGAGGCFPPPPAKAMGPGDPRYAELVARGYNGRFSGRPESVSLVHRADHVVAAVDDALRTDRRIVVRSGGHCFENFVDDPAVQVVVDVSEMKSVYYDSTHRAFAIESGATLGEVYRTLYLGWGVTIPAGACPSVGAGGHIAGGGYGGLSRHHGFVADHLYGVEVVVADCRDRARLVLATRDPADPHHDLWWAHTGGGGGNFGIVTRYLMRSPGARRNDPTTLLPRPPATIRSVTLGWSWADMTESAFVRILRNHGTWHEKESGTGSRYAPLSSWLILNHRATGRFTLVANVDGSLPHGKTLLDEYVAAITANTGVRHETEESTALWMKSTLTADPYAGGRYPFKSKAALLRKSWTEAQIRTLHRYLTQGGEEHQASTVYLSTLGARINTVPASATAIPHRNSLFSATYETSWWPGVPGDAQLAWVRDLYRDVYADTGGVPVPDAANGGAYINYPDADLTDPRWNTSGVPWHTFYYRDNYPRLQQVKARWDPANVFRHAMSVRLPGR
ncbi:FAD-binding protein [Streptomyces halobius]|uniref:FAD-binding protein n=1 Tax=Streptomyces halobius TaxID=2879846 RepID=A0ABY4MNY1_9ACTN|nr:FAD-binding protein [Streptomyces halobius]